MSKKRVRLCRASAGAGKTHRLVISYIEYALSASKGIEAVVALTFTNKATEEMRERIGRALEGLCNEGKESPYYPLLKSQLTGCVDGMERLNKLWFSWRAEPEKIRIYTIDAFLQRHYSCLIPLFSDATQPAIIRAPDPWMPRFLTDLFSNERVYPLLKNMLIEQIAKGQALTLYDLVQEQARQAWYHQAEKVEDWTALWKEKQAQYETYQQRIKLQAKTLYQDLKELGLTASDMPWGKQGVFGMLEKTMHYGAEPLSARARAAAQSIRYWVKKGTPYAEKVENLYHKRIKQAYDNLLRLHTRHFPQIKTWQHLRLLYPMKALQQHSLLTWQRQTEHMPGILGVDFISKLCRLGAGVAPRPTATYWVLDESQDISIDQWRLLRPLIRQGLKEAGGLFAVGDVKQSIYRWRGADPTLFLNQIPADLTDFGVQEECLAFNYRSLPSVVAFNNDFFPYAVDRITDQLTPPEYMNKEERESVQAVKKAYAGSCQKPIRSTTQAHGVVIKKMLDNPLEEPLTSLRPWKERALAEAAKQVILLQKKGVQREEIAFLVRTRSEAFAIADYFSKCPLPANLPRTYLKTNRSMPQETTHHPMHLWLTCLVRCLLYPQKMVYFREAVFAYHRWQKASLSEEEPFNKVDWINRLHQIHPFFERWQSVYRQVPAAHVFDFLWQIVPSTHPLRREESAWNHYQTAWVAYVFNHAPSSNVCAFVVDFFAGNIAMPGSVPEVEKKDGGMPIVTIHQAKGLAYQAVLVPFADWRLEVPPHARAYHWYKTTDPSFKFLGAVPFYYSRSLLETVYRSGYIKERVAQQLEQLNLLYVAFTRACNLLYAWLGESAGRSPKNRMGPLIEGYLENHPRYDQIKKQLVLGDPILQGKTQQALEAVTSKTATTLSAEPDKLFFSTNLPKRSNKLHQVAWQLPTHPFGDMLHQWLAGLLYRSQLPDWAARWRKQRRASSSQIDRLVAETEHLWAHYPKLSDWFSTNWTIVTERSIWSGQQVFRIDRFMSSQKGGQAILLDYKSGKKQAKDKKQLQQYMALLSQMGYKKLTGYLLYWPTDQRPLGELLPVLAPPTHASAL